MVHTLENVLVTGGYGFIGSHLVKELLSRNYRVSVVDIKNGESNIGSAKFYQVDIRNKEKLSDIVKKERIDTCIHLAASVSVWQSIKHPEQTMDINVNGTTAVLDACAHNNVSNFIFASSAAVYGDPILLPLKEEHPLKPLSPYGVSKMAGERRITTYNSENQIPHAVSLRFFNVYGEGQTAEYAGVITKFAERLSMGLPPIVYGNGSQTRDFVSVQDVVRAIVLAANSEASGIFNVGSGRPVSIMELATQMIKIAGLDLEPVFHEAKEGDILHSHADTTKSAEVLHFIANEKLHAALERVMKPMLFRTRNNVM